MKLLLPFLFLLLLVSCNNKSDISLKLIPVKQGDYWGYIDKDGKFIINPQFKEAYTFKEGLALIENTENKYGYIDESGKMIINPQYKNAGSFNEGLAPVVKENEKIEYIDNTGKIIINLDGNVETASGFDEGFAIVKINGNYGYINKDGKVIVNAQYVYAYKFSEGLALIAQKIKDKTKYGYIDKDGKVTVPPQFDDAGFFSEGKAMVKIGDKYGYIDEDGKISITPQFDNVSDFHENYAAVQQGDLWGFIDKSGKFTINPQFKIVYSFNNSGLCPFKSTTNEKWGYVNKDGKIVIDPQFDYVSEFYDKVAITELNNKYGVIDKDGKTLVNPLYDDICISTQSIFSTIYSDYFDISSISGILFKDINNVSVRGITKDMNFTNLQTEYSGLTHDNYSNYTFFDPEINMSIELSSIDFDFNNGFTTFEPKYTTQPRYNYNTYQVEDQTVYDGLTTLYHDDVNVKTIVFTYKLLDKALLKEDEIIKKLEGKIPADFVLEVVDDNTIILDGTNYNLALLRKGENLYFAVSFDKTSFDALKKTINNSSSNYGAAVDTTKKVE